MEPYETLSVGADASLVPVETQPISATISYDETPSLLGQRARDVLASPAAACVTDGYAVYDEEDGKQIAIGDYGLTPEMLERSGTIKPGSAKLVRAQIARGVKPDAAYPDSMFTGKYGASNLNQLTTNKQVQANIQLGLFQTAQSSLQSAGVIKGTESPEQIAGLVYADSVYGTPAVTQTIRTINTRSTSRTSQSSARTQAVLRNIGRGNAAAASAAAVNGPYKALASSVAAYYTAKPGQQASAARGLRGASVDAVVNSLGINQAFTPVSLSRLARERGVENWSALMLVSPGGFKDYLQTSIALTGRNAVNTAIELAKAGATGQAIASGFYQSLSGGATASVNGLKTSLLGAYQGVKAAALFLGSGQFSLAANALATGLGGLPGGVGVAANALQSGIAAVKILPGQIKDIFSTAKTAISGFQSAVEAGKISNFINNTKVTIDVGKTTLSAAGTLTTTGGGVSASFNSAGFLVDQSKTIFNAGSAAYNQIATTVTTALTSVVAIYNAVSAIASLFGGKRKTKVVTMSRKTAQRQGIRKHGDAILADDKIPRPLVWDEFEGYSNDRLNEIKANARAQQAARDSATGKQGPGQASGVSPDNRPFTGGGAAQNTPTGTAGSIDTGQVEVDSEAEANRILRETEAQSTARQNFLNNEVKAAQAEYDQARRTFKPGDPRITQKQNELNNLITNMDSIIAERRGGNAQGGLLVNGMPYNQSSYGPGGLYNQPSATTEQLSDSDKLSGIPPQYRAYYARFGKLPPNAKV